jgi:hypothetical protein
LQGINVATNSTVGTFTIELNKVNRVRNNNITTFGAYGINLGGSTGHVVRNNFVSNVLNDQTAGTGAFSTTFGAFGIRILGTGHFVYHNSVHLSGALQGTVSTNLTAALAIVGTTQTGLDVRNNLFSNQITGGNPTGTSVRHPVVFLPSGGTSAMNLTWNNNGYFEGLDPKSRLAQVGTTAGAGEFWLLVSIRQLQHRQPTSVLTQAHCRPPEQTTMRRSQYRDRRRLRPTSTFTSRLPRQPVSNRAVRLSA